MTGRRNWLKVYQLLIAIIMLVLWGSASDVFSAEIILRPTAGLNDGSDNGSATAGKDAYAWSCGGAYDGANAYFGGSPRSSCNQCNNKGYIQFDLASLPANVDAVYLGVTHYPHTSYCYSNCNANFYFYPLLEAWNEMTIGSGAMPAEGSAVYGPLNITFPNDFGAQEYDITDIYRSWKSGSVQNNGLAIYSPDGSCNNASVGFSVHSSDDSDENLRPYLRVVYQQVKPATAVPTMNEWGMVFFMILAGIGAAYHIRRQKRLKN